MVEDVMLILLWWSLLWWVVMKRVGISYDVGGCKNIKTIMPVMLCTDDDE